MVPGQPRQKKKIVRPASQKKKKKKLGMVAPTCYPSDGEKLKIG
jgi:hypothetical protein